MISLLAEHPLLLFFIVVALGSVIGNIRIFGANLGVAAVLFVALGFGALDARMSVPPIFISLGLILFVYSVGLSSGPGLRSLFSKQGLRDNVVVALILVASGALVLSLAHILGLTNALAAGIYAGSLTNTPALAQLVSSLNHQAAMLGASASLSMPVVVGYSVCYPMGVLGPMFAIGLCRTLWRIDFKSDAQRVRGQFATEEELVTQGIRVTQKACVHVPLKKLVHDYGWRVVFARRRHEGHVDLLHDDSVFELGDEITIVGSPVDTARVLADLGEAFQTELHLDRSDFDFRRVFVSNRDVVGRRLGDLDLARNFGAVVTRLRRGDIELLAKDDVVLEYGDRVRFVVSRHRVGELSTFFGDSYKALSEVDLLTVGIGIAMGLLLGLIPFNLPGGLSFRLGEAGGPLLVGMLLGALRRTGTVVWTIPYSANLTLRQWGLILLLAGIGIRSGSSFWTTLSASGGIQIFLAGACVSIVTASVALWVLHKGLKLPFAVVTGMVSAVHTQPAVHAFAVNQAKNELPNHGYALAFPMATITKIIMAQVILAWMAG